MTSLPLAWLVFLAQALPPAVPESSTSARRPTAEPPTSPTAPRPQWQKLDLLTFYKDNYFLTGFTGTTEVKLQFSAKFDLWPNQGQHAVYFGFTQKSLWNLYESSQPFAENNYAPELFYNYFHHPGRYDPPAGCGFFSERVGLLHESNGEDAARSRGWNRAYVESRFACYDEAHDYVSVTAQVWTVPFSTSDNPKIVDYQGYGELSVSMGRDDGADWLGDGDVTARARKGARRSLSVGSLEFDGRWRPRYGHGWRFTPYLYVQLFTGYGETLLAYDRSVTAFRVGIGLTDRSTRSD